MVTVCGKVNTVERAATKTTYHLEDNSGTLEVLEKEAHAQESTQHSLVAIKGSNSQANQIKFNGGRKFQKQNPKNQGNQWSNAGKNLEKCKSKNKPN